MTKLDPCPLCQSPHVNIARDLRGEPQRAFCKVCDCHAPLHAWNIRSAANNVEINRLRTINADLLAALEEADAMMERAAPKDAWEVLCGVGDVVGSAIAKAQLPFLPPT